MTYLLIYLLCGAIAFFWVTGREKAPAEDALLLPLLFLSDPTLWLVWMFWPVALLVYRIDLREKARLLREERKNRAAPTYSPPHPLLGKSAKAVTRMNPTGVVEFGDCQFEARAEGGFIDKDESVLIVRQMGVETVVRKEPNPES